MQTDQTADFPILFTKNDDVKILKVYAQLEMFRSKGCNANVWDRNCAGDLQNIRPVSELNTTAHANVHSYNLP